MGYKHLSYVVSLYRTFRTCMRVCLLFLLLAAINLHTFVHLQIQLQ